MRCDYVSLLEGVLVQDQSLEIEMAITLTNASLSQGLEQANTSSQQAHDF